MIQTEGSIFVGIPSYRDSLVVDTIKILQKNSDIPSRVFIHVFLQHDLSEECDHKTFKDVEALGVSIELVPHTEAKNAYYARYKV